MYIEREDGSKAWKYEHEVPGMGDSTYVAAAMLAVDIESYLFDYDHPGYDRKEFLSWALSRFDSFKSGSGGLAQDQLLWDPRLAGVKPDLPDVSPRAKADHGIRYPDGAIEHPDIDTSPDVPGEAELYGKGEVPHGHLARFLRHGAATVVGPRNHETHETHVEPEVETFHEVEPKDIVGDEDKFAEAKGEKVRDVVWEQPPPHNPEGTWAEENPQADEAGNPLMPPPGDES